jgi:hypothetical protein
MQKLSIATLALVAVLFTLSFSSTVRADNWDKKTVVTFVQDVEIPGQILPAGTYVFRLFRSSSDRSILQVWAQGESQLVATLITAGESYPNRSGKPYFVLDMTGTDEGYPPALVSWSFAGSDEGRHFIYNGYSTTRMVYSEASYQSEPE